MHEVGRAVFPLPPPQPKGRLKVPVARESKSGAACTSPAVPYGCQSSIKKDQDMQANLMSFSPSSDAIYSLYPHLPAFLHWTLFDLSNDTQSNIDPT